MCGWSFGPVFCISIVCHPDVLLQDLSLVEIVASEWSKVNDEIGLCIMMNY